MKARAWIGVVVLLVVMAAVGWQWRHAAQKRAEHEAMSQSVRAQKDQSHPVTNSPKKTPQPEMQALQKAALEQNQQLQPAANDVTPAPPTPIPLPPTNHFPKEKWGFAGYDTPEAALVSVVAAMRDGNPNAYLDTLAPDEQQRLIIEFENKTEQDLVAKHKSDIASIQAIRILGRQEVSPNEVLLKLSIEGTDRVEKARMMKVEQQWKFNGFIH